MSKDGIRLHPKYGVNPTIPTCAWCGKDKNEVALLGAAYKGQAPTRMVLDHQPCDDCRAQWDKGIAILEVKNDPGPDEPPQFTGRMVVITDECAERILGEWREWPKVRQLRRLYIEDITPFLPPKVPA